MKRWAAWVGAVFVVVAAFDSLKTLTGAHGGELNSLPAISALLVGVALVLAPALIVARFGLWRLSSSGPGSRLLMWSLVSALAVASISFAMPFTVAGNPQGWERGAFLYTIQYTALPALGMFTVTLTALGSLRAKLVASWVATIGLVAAGLWVAAQAGTAAALRLVSVEGVIAAGVVAITSRWLVSGFYVALGVSLLYQVWVGTRLGQARSSEQAPQPDAPEVGAQ